MSRAQRHIGFLKREARQARTPTAAEALGAAAKYLLELEQQNKRLRDDAARLDWLADPANIHGAVSLPRHCVEANLHSMRDAIDAAMEIDDDAPDGSNQN